MRLLFFSFLALLLAVGLLLAPSTSVAQRSIPLTLHRHTNDRASVLLSLRRGDRVICDDQDSDALGCGDEVHLPGPGTYRVVIELTPIGDPRRLNRPAPPAAKGGQAQRETAKHVDRTRPDHAWHITPQG